jgi:threonine/homoserine/homoserine lactone efflux protein
VDAVYVLIGNFLPSAVGVAISPIPIIAVILMLGTPRARTDGPAFAAGWVVGMVAVSVIVLVVTGTGSMRERSYDTVNWGQVVLGLVFFALARREWRSRPAKGEPAEMPGWMQAIDQVKPGKAFGLGAALSALNPKNLALTAAAAAQISQAELTGGENVVAIGVFVAIASVTVVGAVVFYLLVGARADKPLAALKEFMVEHNVVIMVVILLVLGAKLLGDGFGVVATSP